MAEISFTISTDAWAAPMIEYLWLGSLIGEVTGIRDWEPSLLNDLDARRRVMAAVILAMARFAIPEADESQVMPHVCSATGIDPETFTMIQGWVVHDCPDPPSLFEIACAHLTYEERLAILEAVFAVARQRTSVPQAMGEIGAGRKDHKG